MKTMPVLASARRLFLYREAAEAFYGACLRALLVGGRTGLLVALLLISACSVNPYRDEPKPGDTASGETARTPETSRESAMGHGCCAGSATKQEREVLNRVAEIAQKQIGVPYRYGGHTPKGFDCSGLVFYSYSRAGVNVPRTSDAQLRASRELKLSDAVPGDLLFFTSPDKVSHVGIYVGNGRFVHAPSTGKRVTVNELSQEYYQRHLVGIGRLPVAGPDAIATR